MRLNGAFSKEDCAIVDWLKDHFTLLVKGFCCRRLSVSDVIERIIKIVVNAYCAIIET